MKNNFAAKLIGFVTAAAAVVCLMTYAGNAEAYTADAYVCKSTLYPGNGNNYGEAGMLRLYMYTGPQCSGSYLGYFVAYTRGGTYSEITSTYYLYSEAQLMGVYRNAYDAAQDGAPVYFYASNSTNQLYYITFDAN